MAKSNNDIKELQRILHLLDRLERRAIPFAGGIVLVESYRVRDPRPLVSACQNGRIELGLLHEAMELGTPIPIDDLFLAKARRALRILERSSKLRALAEDLPRLFRRYGAINKKWFVRKAKRLRSLTDRPGIPETPFERVLELIAATRGPAAAHHTRQLLQRLLQESQRRREHKAQLIETLIEKLSAPENLEGPMATAVRALLPLTNRSLRQKKRRRRVLEILRELLTLHADVTPPPTADLEQLIRSTGSLLLQTIPSSRSPTRRARAETFCAWYALLFDPRKTETVRSEVIDSALDRFGLVLCKLGGRDLSVDQVLSLLSLGRKKMTDPLIALAEQGVSIDELRRLVRSKQVESIKSIRDVKRARSYATWVDQLSSHFPTWRLHLPPDIWRQLPHQKEDLAVLALCLRTIQQDEKDAMTLLKKLGSLLLLFPRWPEQARQLMNLVNATTPGVGSAVHPEFAAWLDHDPLLDRYIYLLRAAGKPAQLSTQLLADFEAQKKNRQQEVAFLESLPSRTKLQERRLERLCNGQTIGPARTQRRISRRNNAILAEALLHQIDRLLIALIRRVWGIAVPEMTLAWSAALQCYLGSYQNRELLGILLRLAAGGGTKRSLPKNGAWIARAGKRFDVEAWLAPRTEKILFCNEPMTLDVEQNPIEALQLGVPFDTCLSIPEGECCDATVINVADANKQVLYLRGRKGTIVARKLVAISRDWKMIGYRVYRAGNDPSIEVQINAFCMAWAKEMGIEITNSGIPEQIHQGYWYDDGPKPFYPQRKKKSFASAYAASLGLSAPVDASNDCEVRFWDAAQRNDWEVGCSLLDDLDEAAGIETGWLIEAMGLDEATRRAARDYRLREILFKHLAATDPLAMLRLAARIDDAGTEVWEVLDELPRSTAIAEAFVKAAEMGTRNLRYSDHNLDHQTLYQIGEYVAVIPLERTLALCDRLDRLWSYILEHSPDCRDCVQNGTKRLLNAALWRYEREPVPELIIRTLRQKRPSRLQRRVLLAIAARFVLADDDASYPGLQAVKRLRALDPTFENEPDLLAALLRQAGTRHALPEPWVPVGQSPPTHLRSLRSLRAKLARLWVPVGQSPPTHLRSLRALPMPDRPPFDALRDLISHEATKNLTGEKEDAWTMAWRRRHADPSPLVKRAMRGDRAAMEQLAQLGCVEELRALPATTQRIFWISTARDLRAQVTWSPTDPIPERLSNQRTTLDALFMEHLFARIKAQEDPPALKILLREGTAHYRLVRILAEKERLTEHEQEVAARVIEQSLLAIPLQPRLLLRLFEGESFRPALLRALLDRVSGWEAFYQRINRELGPEADELLQTWTQAAVKEKGPRLIAKTSNEEIFRTLLRAVMDPKQEWRMLVEIANNLHSWTEAAIFLQEVKRAGCLSYLRYHAEKIEDPNLRKWLNQYG